MNILLKSAKIIDSLSEFHLQIVDILIIDGKINQIGTNINLPEGVTLVSFPDLQVSPGWFDSSVSFGDPGYEERETLENGIHVAAKSGFTQVAINPNCQPKIDNKSIVTYIKSKAFQTAVNIHPIGNLTVDGKGEDITEIYDMHQAGAIAFGDYKKSIKNPNLVKIGLQYHQNFGGLMLSFPETQQISGTGIVNEGENSIRLGLKGKPNLSETLQISRDLQILAYTGGKLHIPTISTLESVALIKEAKQKGLQVTCSVAAHNLTLTDQELHTFDSNYKLNPPLRTEKDRLALIEGLLDNTIDIIVSDHNPIDIENKKIEFAHALNGSIGLESLFVSLVGLLPIEVLIEKLTHQPKQIFNIPSVSIQKNTIAELSLFTTQGTGFFEVNNILSTSKNAAYLGKPTQGKVYGTFHNGILTLS